MFKRGDHVEIQALNEHLEEFHGKDSYIRKNEHALEDSYPLVLVDL